ncbi:MAG: FAD:protein FMN transferase [Deltaproteobacteria bacterium]|nr:FAD:protein FMN transferase [Deltaproteobacteria bacterium]
MLFPLWRHRLPPVWLAVAVLLNCKAPAPAPAPPPPAPDAATAATPPAVIEGQRTCMGTLCTIKVYASDEAKAKAAIDQALEEMARLEGLMTTWREDSEVSRINAAAGANPVAVSPETFAVIKESQRISELTEGAFDLTVGAFKGLWKFDEDNDGSLPTPAQVRARKALVNYRDIVLDAQARTVMLRRPGQRITLGGVAKGFAVDGAVAVLRKAGFSDFIVQAGGDLFAGGQRGDRAWRVGIQDPRGPHGQIIYKVELHNQAFNTSGDYERFIMKNGKRYHHILDARTGFPAQGIRSVTLLAPSAFVADLMDTALLIVGVPKAMSILAATPDVQGVIVDAKNVVHISPGLQAKLQKVQDPTDAP